MQMDADLSHNRTLRGTPYFLYMLGSLPFEPLREVLQRSRQHLPLGPSSTLWFIQGPNASRELIRPRAWDRLKADFESISSPASALWLSVLRCVFDYYGHLGLADGHGRCLLLLTELFDSLLTPLKSFKAGNKIFSGLCDHQRSALEQQHVLRLLMQHRGILLYDKTPSEENGRMVGVDWLDRITHDTIIELAKRGDFFFLGPCTADQKGVTHGTRQNLRPASLYTLVAGTAYHLLATELEGDVRDRLHHVLMEFLFRDEEINESVQASTESSEPSSSATEAEQQQKQQKQLERCKQRLEAFYSIKYVKHCLANSLSSRTPFSATARDEMPTFAGSVSYSQLLPPSLILLPIVGSGMRSSSGRFFTITTGPCCFPSSQLGGLLRRQDSPPVRVLLLRLDPAGEWLPESEDLYNTQTFFSYYSNDANNLNGDNEFDLRLREAGGAGLRGTWRRKGVNSDAVDGEESFYEMQARQAGIYNYLEPNNMGWKGRECSSVCGSVTESHHCIGQNADEIFFEGLVDRACTQFLPSCREKENDRRFATLNLEFIGAARLFIWCLLHGVRVVLTPERVPPLFKRFGEEYGCTLRRYLKYTEGICLEREESSFDGEIEEESLVRIVDELHLECFERLLITLPCLHEPSEHSERFVGQSAAVLSRNRLRLPSVAEDVLLDVSECTLTTVEAALHRNQVQERPMMAMPNSVNHIPTSGQLVCALRLTEPLVVAGRRSHPPSFVGSILIAAPTRELEQRWVRLFQKCIATLRSIFHDPSYRVHSFSENAAENSVNETGVIRAGGAFFFSFHRCLRRQIRALISGHCGSSFCGLQVLVHTLGMLASACFSMPQHLARRIMANTTLDHPGGGGQISQGPRAREYLWRLATQHVAELDMPSRDHELHVFLKSFHEEADMLLRSGKVMKFGDGFVRGGKETFHFDENHLSNLYGRVCHPHGSYSEALRLFASDLTVSPQFETMGEVESSEDQRTPPRWMFVEAIAPNKEAVRLALVACYLIAVAL